MNLNKKLTGFGIGILLGVFVYLVFAYPIILDQDEAVATRYTEWTFVYNVDFPRDKINVHIYIFKSEGNWNSTILDAQDTVLWTYTGGEMVPRAR